MTFDLLPTPAGHPPVANAEPSGRATPLGLERLQQLLWRRLQEKEPPDPPGAHLLQDLRGGRGDGPQSASDPKGTLLLSGGQGSNERLP